MNVQPPSADNPPATEAAAPERAALDTLDVPALVAACVDDQARAIDAVRAAAADIARAIDAAVPRLTRGGRLVYAGAGTSGRLGVLDGVELLPTFSWPPERVVPLLAGGERAMFRAVEGAEDDAALAEADARTAGIRADDVVIVLAASGATPYALGVARAARAAGALAIGIANNPGAPLTAACDIGITLATGFETIAGSTRLAAGTAQKIALNTLSTAMMVRLGKVHGNLMVDVQPTNAKLRLRALRLVMRIAGCDEADARAALDACQWHVKTAALMHLRGLDADAARARLAACDDRLRAALEPA